MGFPRQKAPLDLAPDAQRVSTTAAQIQGDERASSQEPPYRPSRRRRGEAERRRAALLSSPVANGCLVPHFPLSFLTPRRRELGLDHAPLDPPRSEPAGGLGGAADHSRPGRGRGSSRGQRGREASAGPGAAGGERAEGSHRPPLPLPRPPTLLPSPGGAEGGGLEAAEGGRSGSRSPALGVCQVRPRRLRVAVARAAPGRRPGGERGSARLRGAHVPSGPGARRGAAFLPGCWGGASTFHLESLDVPPEPGAGGRGAGRALGLRGRPATRMRSLLAQDQSHRCSLCVRSGFAALGLFMET